MVSVGDAAPDFTAPLATGDVEQFTLSDSLDDAPIVLAFFPGAFTGTCSHELQTFEDRLGEFGELGARVLGISVDTPFALNAFRDELGLSFDLVSDTNRRLVEAYDVRTDFASIGVEDLAKRAVFVVDGDGVVRFAWVSDDPGIEPDYDDVYDAVASLAETPAK
jgi:peroxiredoxin